MGLCVCIFFVIGMEGAPKPKPKAEPKPQPKAEPFPPIRYPPYIPGANPGPGNWNGFPPTRGDYPWQRNGSPLYYGSRGNRKGYYPWQRNWNKFQMNRMNRKAGMTTQPISSDPKRCNDLDGYKYWSYSKLEKLRKELWAKPPHIDITIDGAGCFDEN